jgi:hypothetical protein
MNTSVVGTHVVAGGRRLLSSHLVSVRVDSARRPRVRFTRFQLMIAEGGFLWISQQGLATPAAPLEPLL